MPQCIQAYTHTRIHGNPGDAVLSPFMGIGSEGYCSLKARRRFVGVELKSEYFNQATRTLADVEASAATLFDAAAD